MGEGGKEMMSNNQILQHRLKFAGLFLIGGLIIAAVTLFWSHPISFMINLFISTVLIIVGIIIYLYSIVSS